MPKLGRRREQTELDHQWNNAEVTGNAPFGTSDTPTVRVKIIGGKPVTVYEERRPEGLIESAPPSPRSYGSQTSRSQKIDLTPRLAPLTEKPNEFNPTLFADRKGNTFTSAQPDAYNSHRHTPELAGSNRFNPHPVLPPISPGPSQNHSQLQQNDVLSKYKPSDGYLPMNPNVLSKQEELELRRRIHSDLQGFDPRKLKDIYLELTGFDRNLTGFVNYSDLGLTLMRTQVHLSADNLRLVASMFVDGRQGPGMVDYEKLLSFLGSSLKTEVAQKPDQQPNMNPQRAHGDGHPTAEQARNGVYFNPITLREDDYSPQSNKFPYGDRDNAKLLRMVEQQLYDAEEEVDLYKAWQVFRAADRDHRGKMSRDQIKSLAFACRIPLQESLLNHIIDKCDCSNAQYDWGQFLDFIERVQPMKTGLGIPESKKPTEFVKHFPQPSVNWPRNAEETLSRPSPRENAGMKQNPQYETDTRRSKMNKQDLVRQRANEDDELERQIENLRQNYEGTKRKAAEETELKEGKEAWFERFMEMASSLYNLDVHGVGYLSADQVKWTVDRYNEAFRLDLSDELISKTVQSYTVNGRVVLDPFLKSLGAKDH